MEMADLEHWRMVGTEATASLDKGISIWHVASQDFGPALGTLMGSISLPLLNCAILKQYFSKKGFGYSRKPTFSLKSCPFYSEVSPVEQDLSLIHYL